MIDFRMELAGIPFMVRANYESTRTYCEAYLTDKEPLFSVSVSREDLEKNRVLAENAELPEGRERIEYNEEAMEQIALYRNVLKELLAYDCILFHSSVVAYDGFAYAFTAPPGTGKTTHTSLWLKNIPGCHILNGDKPLFLFSDTGILVCGTPWRGKEGCGLNETLPLRAIAIIERAPENSIQRISFADAFNSLLTQTFHPEGNTNLLRSTALISKLGSVELYRLRCNMDDEAARVAFEGLCPR